MRHAKPELPMNGRVYYGQTDYPLSAQGIAAAEEVGEYLKGKITFDYLYASDMIRAQQTARLVAPYLPITTVPALREVNLGEWEGRGYDEVREQFREIYEARGVKFAEVARCRPLRRYCRPAGAAPSSSWRTARRYGA